MKAPFLRLLVLLALLLAGFSPIAAQTTALASLTASNTAVKKARHHKKNLANLTHAERAQFKAAMRQVKGDPQLASARQARKEAQTKESRVAARESMRNTRRDLLLKADPALAPILEKMHSPS